MPWSTPIYFSRMLHGRGVCRLASPRTVAAAVTGGGDLVSQLVLERREELDGRRLLTCACLGFVLDGVALQGWFSVLHARVPLGEGRRFLVQRLLLHHAAFAPLLVPGFIAAAAVCEARSEPWKHTRQAWWHALCAHWLLVAPSQVVNACLVPRHFQVLLTNTCALVWAAVLSRACHRPLK